MKKMFIIFLMSIILSPSAIAEWFYNSQNIIVDINILSDMEVVPTTPTGYIESATINMTFFPKETENQKLLSFHTEPEADIDDKILKFEWKRPKGNIEFSVDAEVKITNAITGIKQKIKFPIEELPQDIAVYTKPSKTIDSSNEDIIRIASELVKGEDDLYVAVFKIADWTKNNIKYNLSTLTAEVSQKASWVLANKQGVCDELTSLFIALLRSVGVPARFISGISYTNSPLFPENWGAHGWAEVYFPSYGWVPFDVTYGEFGWIDPTHIKFKDSVDSDEPSTYYQWFGRNANLETKKLDIKTKLINAIGNYKVPLSIEAFPSKKSVNFGSYNLVEAVIENLNDFYYATELSLSKPKEINIVGDNFKSILLTPREKKKVHWILKVDENLDRKYSYTFPLIVSTPNNLSSETSFAANIREADVSFKEVENLAKLLEEEKEKQYSANVILDCKIGKSEFYEYEDVKINCGTKNTGNIFLEDVDICFEGKCNKIDLGISQTKNVAFEVDKSKIGQIESTVTLRNDIVSKSQYVNFKIDDVPKIEIKEIEFPINVSYNENFTISFTLAKKSQSNPKNVEVVFSQNSIAKKWNINELTENREFVISSAGSQLKYGKNNYRININYYDELKRSYNEIKEFSIELTKANLVQRLFLSLNIFDWISHESIALMLLTGTIVFLLGVLWLFRRSRKFYK